MGITIKTDARDSTDRVSALVVRVALWCWQTGHWGQERATAAVRHIHCNNSQCYKSAKEKVPVKRRPDSHFTTWTRVESRMMNAVIRDGTRLLSRCASRPLLSFRFSFFAFLLDWDERGLRAEKEEQEAKGHECSGSLVLNQIFLSFLHWVVKCVWDVFRVHLMEWL